MTTQHNITPILYSFRRCPYAIRARMALCRANIAIELREVVLKDKPEEMLKASNKGSVPILVCQNGHIIDESLDIMLWALQQYDPDNWLDKNTLAEALELITSNDTEFKPRLDRYKYAVRYPEHSENDYREQCHPFLAMLNLRLEQQRYLLGQQVSLADVALFPFVRQCHNVQPEWFNEAGLNSLLKWLEAWTDSILFKQVMHKYPKWSATENNAVYLFSP